MQPINAFTISKSLSLSSRVTTGIVQVEVEDTVGNSNQEKTLSKLVIALPTTTISTVSTSDIPAISKSSDNDLYRKLFSKNQRRVGGVLDKQTNEDSHVVQLQRHIQPLITHDNEGTISNDAPKYDTVPIADFGAAMLRGMGVREDEIQIAMLDEKDNINNSNSQQQLALPMPILNRGKREREHKGLGAASNPLLSSSSSSSSTPMRGVKAASRLNSTLSGLTERKPARLSVGKLAGCIVMVWQLDGVPGLEKMLVRSLFPYHTELNRTSQESGIISQLQTVVVGLREALPIEEKDLSEMDKDIWKLIVSLVNTEEEEEKRKKKEQAAQAISSLVQSKTESNERVNSESFSSLPTHTQSQMMIKTQEDKRDEEEEQVSSHDNWLIRGISVRIANEVWRGGKFFRKKGIVIDVISPGVCQLRILQQDGGGGGGDEGSILLDSVPQRVLETALPKVGGMAIVIRGKKKGMNGILIERKKETETCMLRLDKNETSLISGIKFDDIAEYTDIL